MKVIHASRPVVAPGSGHIDASTWQPLLCVSRDYFGTGPRLGRTHRFRS